MEIAGRDQLVFGIFTVLCLCLLALLIWGIIQRCLIYREELRRIDMEIARTSGAERAHWE